MDYSTGVDFYNVKQDYTGSMDLDVYHSELDVDGYYSDRDKPTGIYATANSDLALEDGNITNKVKALFVPTSSNATASYTRFCMNDLDIAAGMPGSGCSVITRYCTFSSPTPGGSVSGNVTWNTWSYCGMGKVCASTAESYQSENFVSVQGNGQEDPASKDFNDAQALWKEVKKALKEDRKSGEGYHPDKYTSEIQKAAEKFKDVVSKHPLSLYAGLSLGFISRAYRILGEHGMLFDYVNSISEDQNLKPQALSVLIASYVDQGQYEEAIGLSDQIIASFSQDPLVCELLYGKGLIHKHYMDDPVKAEEMFRAVIALFPDHPTALSAQSQLEELGQEPLAKDVATTKEPMELSTQSYPNPFNPETSIHFTLPEQGRVVLKIFDIMGREVKTLLDEERSAGPYTALWDGRDEFGISVASGMYFYQLRFKDKVLTHKFTLMR